MWLIPEGRTTYLSADYLADYYVGYSVHAVSDNEYCVNLRLSTTNLLNWLIHILLKLLILIHIQFYLIHNIYTKKKC